MGRVREYKCEVCGVQERDHSRWLLVGDQPQARDLDILNWDDKLAAQPGICHLCCAEHLRVLVGSWMMPDLSLELPLPSERVDRPAPPANFSLDCAYLHSGEVGEREFLRLMLDVAEGFLLLSGSDDDKPPAPPFDA